MSLKLIMYSSVASTRSRGAQVSSGLPFAIKRCKKNDPFNEISGALYCRHDRYLQILEGESTKVDQLMSCIVDSNAPIKCLIHLHTKISQRTFGQWHPRINTSVANDRNLQNFLSRYAAELKLMSSESRIVFNHFFNKARLNRKAKFIHQGRESSLNVFGDHAVSLVGTPDFSMLIQLTPIMLNVCRLLERQARSVDQLVAEYGSSKRDEILGLLRELNHQGLLKYGEDEMASISSKGRAQFRSGPKAKSSNFL